ncbi:MAG TPA: SDR family NAD(P)-dependent oxidoreductase, partial [Candidatus Limnocylindria bacterium]
MAGLDGKVALVTGGARGIGAATATALCAEAALVVIADVVDDTGAALAETLAGAGKRAKYVHLDVTDGSQWERVLADVVREFGRLDILVNNAGIGTMADVEQETAEGWDRVIAVNQKGVWL